MHSKLITVVKNMFQKEVSVETYEQYHFNQIIGVDVMVIILGKIVKLIFFSLICNYVLNGQFKIDASQPRPNQRMTDGI